MMGTHHHHPMTVHIVEKELRQALIAIISLQITERYITSLSILEFISITIMLLIMNVKHGIEKHVLFVVYINICLLNAGRE